jgi:hypothetical protein
MHTRAPAEVSKHVRRLAQRIAPSQEPLFVPVAPAQNAKENECFENVTNVASVQGGERVIGWAIWEWPNTLIEAEFHAVWKSPDKCLTDVTPRSDGESRVLFLPDPLRAYTGDYVDNIRLALRDDAVIEDFIALSEELVRVTRVGKPGQEVRLPADVVVPLAKHHSALAEMLKAGARDHDPCFCGSGRKYSKCHSLHRTR